MYKFLMLLSVCAGCVEAKPQATEPGPCSNVFEDATIEFREPNLGSASGPPLTTEVPTLTIQYGFSSAANSGDNAKTYWLGADEDIEMWIDFALGVGSPPELLGLPLKMVLLIDGIQVPFQLDGTLVTAGSLTLPSSAEVFRRHVVLAHDQVPGGASNCSIVYLSPRGYRIQNWDFTVLKESFAFRARQPAAWPFANLLDAAYTTIIETGDVFGQAFYETPPTDELRLRVPIKSSSNTCTKSSRAYFLTALLDGVQISMDSRFDSSFFYVPAQKMAIAEVAFRGLPVDGRPHALVLYQSPASVYWEYSPGYISHLAEPSTVIGRGYWGFGDPSMPPP